MSDQASSGRTIASTTRGILILLVALAGVVALPAPGQARDVVRRYTTAPAISPLRVTEIYLPKTIRLTWPAFEPNTVDNNPPTQYAVQWLLNGNAVGSTITTSTTCDASFDWTWDATYTFRVSVYFARDYQPLEDPDPCDCLDVEYYEYTQGPWTSISVTPKKATASHNQVVDSRYDLRYGNPTYLDFNFGTKIYRGGLFVGYAADPSRVARTFLKFPFTTLTSGSNVWASSVHAYYTRMAGAGEMIVGAQALASDTWDQAILKWSAAPSLTPANALSSVTLAYTADGEGGDAWCRWRLHGDVCAALGGDGALTVGLASLNEASSGWAYFAKKEYDAALAPCVVYALGAPLEAAGITVTPRSVTGGTSATGIVSLNGPAPMGGVSIGVGTTDAGVAAPASPVTIAAGASSASFNITTAAVMEDTDVGLSATYGNVGRSAVLTVKAP